MREKKFLPIHPGAILREEFPDTTLYRLGKTYFWMSEPFRMNFQTKGSDRPHPRKDSRLVAAR